jgi:dynein heavy chain 1
LLIIKCFRPDSLLQATALYVQTVFETDLSAESSFDLGAMVSDEVPASTPIALISVPGYEPSYRVESLINTSGARSTPVAMGSQEGFTLANQAIAAAS